MKNFILAFFAAATILIAPISHASDYGCKVLLCLGNPNGPKAVAECVHPINQLFHDLSRGKPFPTCELASAPTAQGGRSWAQLGASYYDPCPTGLKALPAGMYAVQRGSYPPSALSNEVPYYAGIGEGDNLAPGNGEGFGPMPAKICVGTQTGSTAVSQNQGDADASVSAGVYEQVVTLDSHGSPNVIDVFVDSTLYRRVRW